MPESSKSETASILIDNKAVSVFKGDECLYHLLEVKSVQDNKSNSSKTIIAHLKNKSASSVDLEIKSLCFGLEDEVGIDALRKVLKVFILETTIRRDFQVVQSYLNVVLKQHLDVIVNTKSLMIELIKLQRIQKESWGQLRGKIQTSLCLIEHMSGQIQ